MYQKAASMSTWKEAIYAFIKGPGWFPGTPRLGDPMGVPEVVKSEFNSMCFIKIILVIIMSIVQSGTYNDLLDSNSRKIRPKSSSMDKHIRFDSFRSVYHCSRTHGQDVRKYI